MTLISGASAEMLNDSRPLNAAEVETVRRWIESGADRPSELELRRRSKADSTWWSLQSIANSDLPNGPEKHPIDRFLRVKLAAEGLAFQLSLSRSPQPNESKMGAGLIKEHGLPQVCRVLLNVSEFVYVD